MQSRQAGSPSTMPVGRFLAIPMGMLVSLAMTGVSQAGITMPDNVSGLKLWLRADTLAATHGQGDTVSTWADGSANSNDATTVSGFTDPEFSVDDLPSVVFKSNDLLGAVDLLGGSPVGEATIIAVYSFGNTSSARPLGYGSYAVDGTASRTHWNPAEDTSLRFDGTAIPNTAYSQLLPNSGYLIRTTTKNAAGTSFDEFFDGVQALAGAAPPTTLGNIVDDFYLGRLHTAVAEDLAVAEVIVYDKVLSAAQRQGVEAYLGAKYGSNAYWRFENGTTGQSDPGTSGNVLDFTVNTNNGTAVSDNSQALPAYSSDVAGDIVPLTGTTNSLSLDFERNNQDYVEIAHDSSISFGDSSFTIEAWVKLETLADGTTATRQYIVHKKGQTGGLDANVEYSLHIREDRRLLFLMGDGSGTGAIGSSFSIDDTTDWHYVSAAFDADNDLVRLMLDDQIVTTSFTFTPAPNTQPLIVGGHYNSGGVLDSTFDGKIDELRITAGFLAPNELLNYVPEPSTIGLLLVGALFAPLRIRRRRK